MLWMNQKQKKENLHSKLRLTNLSLMSSSCKLKLKPHLQKQKEETMIGRFWIKDLNLRIKNFKLRSNKSKLKSRSHWVMQLVRSASSRKKLRDKKKNWISRWSKRIQCKMNLKKLKISLSFKTMTILNCKRLSRSKSKWKKHREVISRKWLIPK